MIGDVFVLGSILLTLGLAAAGVFVRKPLRQLRGARDADALEHWRCASVATRALFR
jgi:hypothetical protein